MGRTPTANRARVVRMADVAPRTRAYIDRGGNQAPLEWWEIVDSCPPLLVVEAGVRALVRSLGSDECQCANNLWYTSVKPLLRLMVGCESRAFEGSWLCSDEAYDVAYAYLYALMPDCAHEGICGWADR